jgi:hypothetical protein
MCENAAIHVDLRISVQVRGAGDRVQGHLAVGILADSPAVLVPDPPLALLDGRSELEVLIIPVPPRREALIERFAIRKKDVLYLRAAPDQPEVAMLHLHGFSRYTAQLGECDPDTLGPALEANCGDWWAALEELEIVPGAIRDLPDEVLREAGAVERRQYRPRYHSSEHRSYRDLVEYVCWPSCKCPHRPHGGA